MYFRLSNEFCLRGWQHLTSCLVFRKTGAILQLLSQRALSLLMLCDGITDVSGVLKDRENKYILEQFLDHQYIQELQEPFPIEDDQAYRYYDNRYFSHVLFSITGKCNFRCRHCYMDAPEGKLGELTTHEINRIIDELADCGIKSVHLTGGEPLIRNDFWEIIDRLIQRQMIVGKVYTNGWLLNESVLNSFEKRGVHPEISISFDGIGWHDWMRRVPGAEKRAIEAIILCRQRGYSVDVEMCLHKGNVSSLRETINFLATLGVSGIKISSVVDTESWKKNSENKSISYLEYYNAVIEYIPSFFKDGMPIDVLFGGVIYLFKGRQEYRIVSEKTCKDDYLDHYLCTSARMSAYITPDGRFLPCMSITSIKQQEDFPLILEYGVKKCLSNSYYMNFIGNRVKDLFIRNKECANCKYRSKCWGGCRAQAMLANNGELYACDTKNCYLFENGYPDKFRAAADAAIAKYCGGSGN